MVLQAENLAPLTSLRFFAAFAIVWAHAALYFPWAQGAPGWPYGHGVSFFFVLSGFIITHVYGRTALPYGPFIWKRIARLWPLHVVTLLSVLLFVRADSVTFDGPGLQGKWWTFVVNAALLQAWIPTQSYMLSWNSVSWSISTEMAFYAAFPLLLVVMRKSRLMLLGLTTLPIALAIPLVPFLGIPMTNDVFGVDGLTLIYAGPLFRIFEFAVGMIAYEGWLRVRPFLQASTGRAVLLDTATAGLLIAWFLWGLTALQQAADVNPILAQWVRQAGSCFLFAIVLITMADSRGPLGWILRKRVLIILGEISFALYMSHQIVMKIVSLDHPQLALPIVVLPLCFTVAALLHYLIEKPAQKLLTRRREGSVGAGDRSVPIQTANR